ncbi:MAG: DNA methyltransferase [Chloroflexota bacterium]
MDINNVETLSNSFSPDQLKNFLRQKAPGFRAIPENLVNYLNRDDSFDQAVKTGVIELPPSQTILVGAVHVSDNLTARSSKRRQYELVKRILRDSNHNAAIFAFYDDAKRFRLSLVTVSYHGTRRQFSTFRRYTFFVDPALPNKTFVQQMGKANFSTIEGILQTFSLEAVSDEFYKEFERKFEQIAAKVQGTQDKNLAKDFTLLFAIRTIFIGFVQKKGWLGDNPRFLQDFWQEYRNSGRPADTFYKEWLEPLFFEALNSPPGRKVAYGKAPFSTETQTALQMAPYLNGELFKCKQGVDDQGLWIPDDLIGDFFDFLFQYNFTVEENELYDEELELNPEFLGIIFERLTNMEQGAVYTPRVEVDLMCRLALVKWLERTTTIKKEDLYHLFFREAGTGEEYDEYQKQGDFSPVEIRALIEKLESVTVCDPAAGSGAFEIGMLQVLDQILENLYTRNNTPPDLKDKAPTPFERKKAIIERSLYGVEVKRWAVWINHLRLWLTLFVDMPDDFKSSLNPLLPNLTFKVRAGDSLVQRIGGKTFPVQEHASLSLQIKHQITELKKKKRDFFYNQNMDARLIEQEEMAVFRNILDEQIKEQKEARRKLLLPRPKQISFIPQPEQQELDFASALAAQKAEIESRIADLEAQKRNLKDERPFIWSIEFAEIFFDRGGFDIIIGNPPYVRQEQISDPYARLSGEEYKEALLEMVRLDFPDYFAKSRAATDQFKKGRQPSGRSDLYTYFYIRSLRLLNQDGVHVFICSNSWLDVGYGAWLQEFFLRKAPLHLVMDNHAKRSFARADVNTVITVAGAPLAKGEVPTDHGVRFLAFKQPFEDAVLSENLLAIENAAGVPKTDAFRVFPITVRELLAEGSDNGTYVGDKWGGKYLRAPDIFFTILEKGKGKLVRLGDIAEVRRGFTTGANEFFYLEPLGPGSRPGLVRVRNGAGWEGEIEEEFLKPVIKSPRECRTIVIRPEDLHYRIFMCPKSKEELKGTKALAYIEWGERQGYHKRSTLRSRRRWWDLGERVPGLCLWPMIHNDRLAVLLNSSSVYVDHNFFEITPHTADNYVASLFSVLAVLIRELYGRSNLGEGALKTEGIDIQRFHSVVVRCDISIKKLMEKSRIQSIFTECGIDPESGVPIAEQEPNPLPDRKALDDIVFDALGLTEEERKEVYRAVCHLVWERISKARSV